MKPQNSFDAAPDAVLGLDNVRLDLPLAGIGSRTLAVIVDQLLVLFLLALLLVGMLVVLPLLDLGLDGGWVLGIFLIVAFLVQWGYFAAFEIAMDGQTPGKMAVGLRTVSSLGGKASALSLLARNFLRGLDLAVGLPLMAVDGRSRRLGDLVASTLVVHHRRPRPEDTLRLHRVPASWHGREVAVVEAFLRRAGRMEPWRAQHLARRLLDWLRRREPELVAEGERRMGVAEVGDPVEHLRRLLMAES